MSKALFGELRAKYDQQILLGGEMQVDCCLGNIGGGGGVIDGGRPDPLLEKQALRGIHDFFAPHFGRLGSRANLCFVPDAPRFAAMETTSSIIEPPQASPCRPERLRASQRAEPR
jgi:hypothetical protein